MEASSNQKVVLMTTLFEMFEDDDDIFKMAATNMESKNVAQNIVVNLEERERHFRPPLYSEEWVSKYSEVNFYRLFRMVPQTFEMLLREVEELYVPKLQRGDNSVVQPRKSLLLTLFYLAHQDSLCEISDRFNVSESTALYKTEYVISLLVSLSNKFIVWPRENDCGVLAREFENRAGFPGVIGAIDGSHIPIIAPAKQQMSYQNRKFSHSVVLQGICTASKLFIDVSVGVPGRRTDGAVLRFSQIYRDCRNHGSLSKFYRNDYHLVGDSAYPSCTWILPPYKHPPGGDLTASQNRYNYKHIAPLDVS